MAPSHPRAEILTIGSEILLGELVDTNAAAIARSLRALGIEVRRMVSVGDGVPEIAEAAREAGARAEILITTGGLGPTVDDPTRDALARAAGVETELRPELWEEVRAVYRRYGREPTENNRCQAYVPRGARAISNPVGTAPAFSLDVGGARCYALPGVPREMERLMQGEIVPRLRRRFDLRSRLVLRTLRCAGAGESQIDERIADLEGRDNPVVGIAAHAGTVDIRIAARGEDEDAARALAAETEAELRARLGGWVFGADEDTLESATATALRGAGWRVACLEAGRPAGLAAALAEAAPAILTLGEVRAAPLGEDALREAMDGLDARTEAEAILGLALDMAPDEPRPGSAPTARILLGIATPRRSRVVRIPYGGPPALAAPRARNAALDLLRREAAGQDGA